MATRQDIQAIIIYMQGLFPNYRPDVEPITPEHPFNATEAMLDALGYIDTQTLRMAVKSACLPGTGREFAPSADDIKAERLRLQAKAQGVPSAGEAWGAVIGSFERMPGGNMAGGGHDNPILDQPLVVEAVREMGGYAAIGVDFFENQMANRAHFLRIYADLLARSTRDAAMIPEAVEYIQAQKQIGAGIKMLTDKLEV